MESNSGCLIGGGAGRMNIEAEREFGHLHTDWIGDQITRERLQGP